MNDLIQVRPLSKAERFYWLVDRAVSTNFVISARMREMPSEAALREVLDLLRERHPMLRSRVMVNGRSQVVLEPAPAGAPFEIEAAQAPDWRQDITRELDRPFPEGAWPLGRVILRHDDASSEGWMHLVVNHGISDARSLATLMVELLGLLSGASPLEPRPAFPSQEALYEARYRGFGALWRWWWFLLRDAMGFAQFRKATHLPGLRPERWRPRRCRTFPFDLDSSATSALVERARAEGTSVQGALCAAQLLAIRQEHAGDQLFPLVVGSAVNMRPSLVPVSIAGRSMRVEDQDIGMYASFTATGHLVARAGDPWALAREVRARVQARVSGGNPQVVWAAFPANFLFPPDFRGAESLLKGILAAPPSTFVTNLGRLDGGSGAASEIRFTMAPQVGSPLCTSAVSHAGCLRVNNTFNVSAIEEAQAERIAEAFGEALRRAIG